jgi:hypothetical protein
VELYTPNLTQQKSAREHRLFRPHTPLNAPYEPSSIVVDHFPELRFWIFGIFMVIPKEHEAVIPELSGDGWEPWNDDTKDLFLLLESHLAQTLIVEERAHGFRYWARTPDLHHTQRYPVLLAHQANKNEYTDTLPPNLTIGTSALVPGEKGTPYHLYTVEQLGKPGHDLCQRIREGMILFSLDDDDPSEKEKKEREQRRIAAWRQTHEAAQALAQLYWDHHHQQIHSVTSIPPVIPEIPNVINQGVLLPAPLPLQAILASYSNAQNGASRWGTGENLPFVLSHQLSKELPTFEYKREDGTTWLQLRPQTPDITLEPSAVEPLWEQVRHLSDVDGDILLTLIAQAIAAPDEKGSVWITSKAILDYRGIQPIMKKENGKKRRAGHRQEDLQEIAACIQRMSDTWISIEQWIIDEKKGDQLKNQPRKKKGKTLYTHDSRLLIIMDEIRQHQLTQGNTLQKTGKPLTVAWRYQLGSWLEPFLSGANYQVVWLLQQVLHYDHYHQTWEKRLARYFTFHLRMNIEKGNTSLIRGVGLLIEELSLSINHRDPEKTRQRFHKAMLRLENDQIISGWSYVETPTLPSRKWLETWLTWKIEIVAAPIISRSPLPALIRERIGQ